ncbi:MAG: sugar transporter permease [Paenibacillaceae bacterium]|jgi:putative aldouronate transport system permease protein|nr:sugar transporter permease [Paenibacillaceae bacterium]
MSTKWKKPDVFIAQVFSYLMITIVAVGCLLPFLLVISGSLSSNESILQEGFGIFPKDFSLEAYRYIFEKPEKMLSAYRMTIIVTAAGTTLSVFLSAMASFVLSRKDYVHRNKFAFYFFFTTIFSGGLIPWYVLCVRYLHFKEMPYIALIIPMLFSFFYMIILRSFMSTIPESIVESARIDGAGDFYIFLKLILPLSKPVIATIVLFTAMGYWNDYYNPMLFVSSDKHIPLQYYLYRIINTMEAVNNQMDVAGVMIQYPSESFKLAMTIVATGPIVLVYPFIQKHIVKGITVGAVKG